MINNPYQPQMMNYTPGYNAYPYNPMQRFQEQQLPQQPVQQVPQQQNLQIQAGINGRMVFVTVPLFLLFVVFRKYIRRGVGRAGIKG